MPQYVYGQQPELLVGQVATNEPAVIDTLTNELLPQISTVTSTGTGADGVYTQTITGPDGESITASYTETGGPGSTTTVSQGILAAFQAQEEYAGFATGASPAAVLTHTFLHPGRDYTITTTEFAGTQPHAITQAAGGVDIELGVAVKEGSADDLVAVLAAGTVDADLAGFHVRGVDALVNDFGSTNSVVAPAGTLSVLRRGTVAVQTEEAVTKGGPVFVRINAPAAGDPVGLCRTDVDGGDAIQMLSASYATTTSGRGIAQVRVNRP